MGQLFLFAWHRLTVRSGSRVQPQSSATAASGFVLNLSMKTESGRTIHALH
jgi:hypothetical protein